MKKFFIVLGVIVSAALIVAVILPKDFEIKQSIIIEKPRKQVFDFVKIMQNAKEWQVWSKLDAETKYELKGNDGEVGAILSWSGNSEVGVGEQEIKNIIADERIDFELRFKEPMEGTNQGYYLLEDNGQNSTKITWVMNGATSFPFNLVCFFMHDSVVKDFILGLENLKMVLESMQDVKVDPDENEEGNAVFKSDLGRFYDLKIISMPFDEQQAEEKETGSKVITKQNLSKYVGYYSYILDAVGEVRKIDFDPNAKTKQDCGDQYHNEDYFYKLSYEGQDSVAPLGEFLFVSKKNPKDFMKFYPIKKVSNEVLNQKMREVFESRYNLKNSKIEISFSSIEIPGRTYKFGSAGFSNYKKCGNVNADFIFDSEDNIRSWRIEEFGCNGGGEEDLVYVDSGLSIDLGSIIGIINLKAQDDENKTGEDWIISGSSGFETSGFKIAKYENGSFDPATESINHFAYFGCPIY